VINAVWISIFDPVELFRNPVQSGSELQNPVGSRSVNRQRWERIRTGSDWSGLKPILAGSGLDRTTIFWKLADQDWIGLRKFLLSWSVYSNHIKNFSCNVILQIYWKVKYILPSAAKLIWDYLLFELHPPLSRLHI